MRLRPKDESTSPLDEVLRELPDEEPPQDLKARCVRALRTAAGQRSPAAPAPLWPTVIKSVAGLAAAFLLVVAATTALQPPIGRGPAQEQPHGLAAVQPELAEAETPAPANAPVVEEAESARGPGVQPRLVTGLPPGEEMGKSLDATSAYRLENALAPVPDSADHAYVNGHTDLATAEDLVGDDLSTRPALPAGEVQDELAADLDFARPQNQLIAGTAPAKPWRDLSGERQKITHKEMEVQVKDVEAAHLRATSIIEKANGYVDSEELRINQGERGSAHLLARVPVEGLDGVVAQLRELGRVVKLIGESDDRTKDYYARGARIRELGAKECELVDEYLAERNRQRKQQLYRQIMAVREQNKQEKQPLLELSDKTHLAFLDLTLSEAGGPARFLSRVLANAGSAGLWLAVSAIFWVPAMLVISLVWRQVGRRES